MSKGPEAPLMALSAPPMPFNSYESAVRDIDLAISLPALSFSYTKDPVTSTPKTQHLDLMEFHMLLVSIQQLHHMLFTSPCLDP